MFKLKDSYYFKQKCTDTDSRKEGMVFNLYLIGEESEGQRCHIDGSWKAVSLVSKLCDQVPGLYV